MVSNVNPHPYVSVILAVVLIALGRDQDNALLGSVWLRAPAEMVAWIAGPTGHLVAFVALALRIWLPRAWPGVCPFIHGNYV